MALCLGDSDNISYNGQLGISTNLIKMFEKVCLSLTVIARLQCHDVFMEAGDLFMHFSRGDLRIGLDILQNVHGFGKRARLFYQASNDIP